MPFPIELCRDLERLLVDRYQPYLAADERFYVRGEVSHSHAALVCEFANLDRTFLLTVETAVECEPNDINDPLQARGAALDYANIVFADFFEKDRLLHFRPIWQEYDLDGVTVLMRGSVSNPLLDSEADRFLAEHGFDETGAEADAAPPEEPDGN